MPSHQLPTRTFVSSPLSIPQSPFSPLSPLFPNIPKARPNVTTPRVISSEKVSAPSSPLEWQWTCHSCTRTYSLGATRRCLDDGHYFCAGASIEKRRGADGVRKRMQKHRACRSEFDYAGWKGRGRWKRSRAYSAAMQAEEETTGTESGEGTKKKKKKNCWTDCDYPSQCRWGKSVGIHTPSPTTTTFTLDSSALASDMPSLDECFTTSPSYQSPSKSSNELNVADLSRALEKDISPHSSSSTFPQTIDESCIDPSLLALSQPSTTTQVETRKLNTLISPFQFDVAPASCSRRNKNGRRALSRCVARLGLQMPSF